MILNMPSYAKVAPLNVTLRFCHCGNPFYVCNKPRHFLPKGIKRCNSKTCCPRCSKEHTQLLNIRLKLK